MDGFSIHCDSEQICVHSIRCPGEPLGLLDNEFWSGDVHQGTYVVGREGFPPGMMLAELGVHTYDLATTFESPTGQLDPDVAEKALAFMQENLKPEIRGDAFDEEKPAPRDADAYQRLAAFAGRDVA